MQKSISKNIHLLANLSVLYNARPEKITLKALAHELQEFTEEQVEFACNYLKKTCKFFPTLAHFYECIQANDKAFLSVDDQVLKILDAAKSSAPRCKLSYENAKNEIGQELMQVCSSIGWSNIVEAKDEFQIKQIEMRLKKLIKENNSSCSESINIGNLE